MTTFDTGRAAEDAAVQFLRSKGCVIIEQNWRTRWCEIDIIVKRDNIIYMCEVKYRRTSRQGTGIDYITPKKLTQMRLAAESWVQHATWDGPYQLCAIEVSGPAYRITNVITNVL